MFKIMLRRATFLAVFCFCLPATAQRLGDFLGVKAWEGSVTVKGTADSSLTSVMGTDHWTLSWDANLQFRLDTFVPGGQFWQGTFTGGNVTVKHKNVNTGLSGCVITTTVGASGIPHLVGGPDPKFFLYAGPGELYSFLTDCVFRCKPNSIPGQVEQDSGLNPNTFWPTPECCSASARNPVRLAPEYARAGMIYTDYTNSHEFWPTALLP